MPLSSDILQEFAKEALSANSEKPTATKTVTGVARKHGNIFYVKIDGSDLLTPIMSSTVGMKDGDTVTVEIQDHKTVVTGNVDDHPAVSSDVDLISGKLAEINVETLNADHATVGTLVANNVRINEQLEANAGKFNTLEAANATITQRLNANQASIETLNANSLTAEVADMKYARADKLTAVEAYVTNLTAEKGVITNLQAETAALKNASVNYANIDFSNIGEAAIKRLFTDTGMVKDLVVNDGQITGTLAGVTILGDNIVGNTIKADKLVIKGTDGVYYALNTNGEKIEAKQTDDNSINGSYIQAKSVTANKIAVEDLVAFGADIGGYHISNNSIYSGAKGGVDSSTPGVFLGSDGQMAVGDDKNYMKFFKDADGQYKLSISAPSIKMASSGKTAEEVLNSAITNVVVEYAQSQSRTTPPTSGWTSTQSIAWKNGYYIWIRTKTVDARGGVTYTAAECISGSQGPKGDTGDQGITGPKGRGVKTVEPEYYLSTSNANQNGGSWSSTEPTWVKGKSIWTRNKVIWDDDNVTYTTPVLAQATNGLGEKYATLEQSVDKFKVEVGETYATLSGVKTIESSLEQNINGFKSTVENTYVTNKTLTKSLQTRTIPDTRNTNQNPTWYMMNYPKSVVTEFKSGDTIGLSNSNYWSLETTVPCDDSSEGLPTQRATSSQDSQTRYRYAINPTEWSPWTTRIDKESVEAIYATKSLVEQTDSSIRLAVKTDIKNLETDSITKLNVEKDRITSLVKNVNDVSSKLTQTSNSLESTIKNVNNVSSKLTQTSNSLESTIKNVDNVSSKLTQTSNSLESTIKNVDNVSSKLTQNTNNIVARFIQNASSNLLQNSSFKQSWAYWNATSASNGTPTERAIKFAFGKTALHLRTTARWQGVEQKRQISLNKKSKYHISAMVRSGTSTEQTFCIIIHFMNNSGELVQNVSYTGLAPTNSWKRFIFSGTITDKVEPVSFRIHLTGNSNATATPSNVYYSEVQFEINEYVSPYSEGGDNAATVIHASSNGVLTSKVGQAMGSFVNASASFDIVPVTWNLGIPSIGTAVSSFNANSVKLMNNKLVISSKTGSESIQGLTGITLEKKGIDNKIVLGDGGIAITSNSTVRGEGTLGKPTWLNPVYMLYNGTDHYTTADKAERDALIKIGWKNNGIKFYAFT